MNWFIFVFAVIGLAVTLFCLGIIIYGFWDYRRMRKEKPEWFESGANRGNTFK